MAKKVELPENILGFPAAYIRETHDKDILALLLRIIDACYESDPNIAKWKPLRDEVERLINA